MALATVAAVMAMAVVIVGLAGIFWLYVFGDDPWPSAANTALLVAGYGAGAVAAVASFVVAMRWRPVIE